MKPDDPERARRRDRKRSKLSARRYAEIGLKTITSNPGLGSLPSLKRLRREGRRPGAKSSMRGAHNTT
jgi:hypothetical protein